MTVSVPSEYNQVLITKKDHPFCTSFGLFMWNPSTLQRLMQRLFGNQQCQSLLLYLDDIIVYSSTVSQYLECLELVLSRLQGKGLKVN